MSGDLSILKYTDKVPARINERGAPSPVPLGTLSEIKTKIEEFIPTVEWENEPSLISMMKENGSEQWRGWDSELIEAASRPKLNGHCHTDDFALTFHSLPVDAKDLVQQLHVSLYIAGNPYVPLQTLCSIHGWVGSSQGQKSFWISTQ